MFGATIGVPLSAVFAASKLRAWPVPTITPAWRVVRHGNWRLSACGDCVKGSAVKVKASVKRICNQCQIVRRKGKVRVICKADPKHKQVQG